jgi:mannose-6-phosphate isomerase-like protein (cupin superfamily)
MKRLALSAAPLVLLTASILGAQVVGSRTTSAPGITRRVMIDERTVQVVRSTYQPGAVEPAGPHSFDVVCVPLSEGRIEVTVAGKSIPWKPGEAFFIGRGVEHRLANHGRTAVDFISIRIP